MIVKCKRFDGSFKKLIIEEIKDYKRFKLYQVFSNNTGKEIYKECFKDIDFKILKGEEYEVNKKNRR